MLAAAAPGRHLRILVTHAQFLCHSTRCVCWPQVGKAASTYSASLFSGEGFVTHFTGVACSCRPTVQKCGFV